MGKLFLNKKKIQLSNQQDNLVQESIVISESKNEEIKEKRQENINILNKKMEPSLHKSIMMPSIIINPISIVIVKLIIALKKMRVKPNILMPIMLFMSMFLKMQKTKFMKSKKKIQKLLSYLNKTKI